MALTRVWTPSGNYSGGSTKRLLVVHTMEGFTGSNGAYDCAKYFQGDCGASSQVCIDNNRGKIWECVSRGYGAWTQCGFNSVSVSCEQSGYASWSRDYWLNNRSNQLHNIADWLAEESKKLGIPLTDLTSSQAQGGSWGVVYHSELGSSGCGHSDPGGGWPIDKVLEWARGGTSTAVPSGQGVEEMASSAFDYQGRRWLAMVWKDGKVNVKPPGGSFYAVDPEQSGAYPGASITASPDGRGMYIDYVNGNKAFCTYQSAVDNQDWGWSKQSPDDSVKV